MRMDFWTCLILSQSMFLNRWLTETESYRINLVGRVLVDEREGGQIRSISNPYKVLIDKPL